MNGLEPAVTKTFINHFKWKALQNDYFKFWISFLNFVLKPVKKQNLNFKICHNMYYEEIHFATRTLENVTFKNPHVISSRF